MKYKIKISKANVTQYYEVNQKFKLYYGVTFFFFPMKIMESP